MRVETPREGEIGNWLVANDTNITEYEITDDADIYCSVMMPDSKYAFFTSTDGGVRWIRRGDISGPVIDFTVTDTDARQIIYTDGTDIFISEDEGYTFVKLPGINGTGSGNYCLTTIDVVDSDGNTYLLAGTSDLDNLEYGEIYYCNIDADNLTWKGSGLTGYDVIRIVSSPENTDNERLFAVATDESNTFVLTKVMTKTWNAIYGKAEVPGLIPVAADLVIQANNGVAGSPITCYLGIDTGNASGDVFHVNLNPLPGVSNNTDMNAGKAVGMAGIDISGVSIGNDDSKTWLFAGTAQSGNVLYTNDNGVTWHTPEKPPTGQRNTLVKMDKNFNNNGKVYTATSGAESAFSCSNDRGISFNQLSMIDTEIGSGCISELTVSPDYQNDTTLFVLTLDTTNMEYSVWRSLDYGVRWERILNSSLDTVDKIRKIALSPQYGISENIVYITGISGGDPVIWRSTDKGQTFSEHLIPGDCEALCDIDNDSVLIGSFIGTDSEIFCTSDGGLTWSTGIPCGKKSLNEIVVTPDYENDGIILAASTGWVYYSDNFGKTFRPLPLDAAIPPFTGTLTVAFDSDFRNSRMIYTGSSTADEGLYRFVLEQNGDWERIDGRLPAGASITDIKVSNSGILYAVNTDGVDTNTTRGGIERSMNPSFHLSPSFETVDKGLDDGMHLTELVVNGNRLWSIDEDSNRILTYYDSMAEPVSLRLPADMTPGLATRDVILDWETVEGAAEYEWQVDYSGYFASVPADLCGNTTASMVRLPELDMDTLYHWRVRVIEPVRSEWSETRMFTTKLGQTVICPVLMAPAAGETLTSSEPLFQWSAIADADKYELIVSKDITFKSPVINRAGKSALPATAWQSDVSLERGQTFYWKVRALGSASYTDWSAVSAFVTPSLPVEVAETVEEVRKEVTCGPVCLSPGAGCAVVSKTPLFQWEPVNGADCYELVVSEDTSFENPVLIKAGESAVPVNAFKSDISLGSGKAYYWRVRAIVNGDFSRWSSAGIFSIETGDDRVPVTIREPAEQQEQPIVIEQILPVSEPAVPVWVVYMGLGLLIAIALFQLAILLVIVVTRTKRESGNKESN